LIILILIDLFEKLYTRIQIPPAGRKGFFAFLKPKPKNGEQNIHTKADAMRIYPHGIYLLKRNQNRCAAKKIFAAQRFNIYYSLPRPASGATGQPHLE
jgi:hypothetical protein